MKICWDNLENVKFTKNGNFRYRNRTYYLLTCFICKEEFLSAKKDSIFCCHSCSQKNDNNSMFGKNGKKNPMFGKHHTEKTKKLISDIKKGIKCPIDRTIVRRSLNYIKRNIAIYDTYAHKIEWCEEVRRDSDDSNILEVKCTYCGKWYIPNVKDIRARVQILMGQGNSRGECRLYCSEGCKEECPIYNQVKWPKGFKPSTSREVQPELRQLVLERDDYKCIKCGNTKNLHCHHIDPVINNPVESADVDNCITLCKRCHIEIHKQQGCKNNELKCKEI